MKKLISIFILSLLLSACSQNTSIPKSYHNKQYINNTSEDLIIELDVIKENQINLNIIDKETKDLLQSTPLLIKKNDYLKDSFITQAFEGSPSVMVFHFNDDVITVGFIDKELDDLVSHDFERYQSLEFHEKQK